MTDEHSETARDSEADETREEERKTEVQPEILEDIAYKVDVSASIDEAQLLLEYVCSQGKEFHEEYVTTIVQAGRIVGTPRWTVDVEKEFWKAFNTLTASIKPVTITSLKNNVRKYGRVGFVARALVRLGLRKELKRTSEAEKIVRRTRLGTGITMCTLLVAQIYWLVGDGVTRGLNIEEREKLVTEMWEVQDKVYDLGYAHGLGSPSESEELKKLAREDLTELVKTEIAELVTRFRTFEKGLNKHDGELQRNLGMVEEWNRWWRKPLGVLDGLADRDRDRLYDAGHAKGQTAGYEAGFAAGYESGGLASEHAAGPVKTRYFQAGRVAGYEARGLELGEEPGESDEETRRYQSGYAAGYLEGYPSGYEDGEAAALKAEAVTSYSRVYWSGYEEGYEEARVEAKSATATATATDTDTDTATDIATAPKKTGASKARSLIESLDSAFQYEYWPTTEPETSEEIAKAKFALDALSKYLLPLLYGLLGAFAYVLRTLTSEVKDLTYSTANNIRYALRLQLGALAGLGIGWFVSSEESLSLSLWAVAFIAGYSVEVMFAQLDKFIRAFSSETE